MGSAYFTASSISSVAVSNSDCSAICAVSLTIRVRPFRHANGPGEDYDGTPAHILLCRNGLFDFQFPRACLLGAQNVAGERPSMRASLIQDLAINDGVLDSLR